jgi:hypothetical protein
LLLAVAPSPPKKLLRRPKLPLSKPLRLTLPLSTLLLSMLLPRPLTPLLPRPMQPQLQPMQPQLQPTLPPLFRLKLRLSKQAGNSAFGPIGSGKAAPRRRPFF